MNKNILAIGIIFFLTSLYLSFFLRYNHFYEFMLTGMSLILFTLISKKSINNKKYLILYICFIFIGFLGDFILGMVIADAWHYSYSHLIEYLFLYLLVYPLGGIVMVQSYLFLKEKLGKRIKKRQFDLKLIIIPGIISLIISILIIILNFFINKILFGKLFFVFSTLFLFFYLSYKTEKYNKISIIGDLINKPLLFIFIIFVSTYVNAFIHEYPNTFVGQWVYTGWYFNNFRILNIPITVLAGWILLLIIPLAIYYYIISFKKIKHNIKFK